MDFKVVISDPKTGKSYQAIIDEEKFSGLFGKKLGDTFDGKIIGLTGYELKIKGGSDRQGFPMRKDVEGTKRIEILLSGGVGFRPKKKGERRRKSVRGNVIDDNTSQLNVAVAKYGTKKLEEVFGKKADEGEKKDEGKAPEKK